MGDQTHKAEQFRALHIPGKPLVLFNIWDAGSAKAVGRGGAPRRLRRAVGLSLRQMASTMASGSHWRW